MIGTTSRPCGSANSILLPRRSIRGTENGVPQLQLMWIVVFELGGNYVLCGNLVVFISGNELSQSVIVMVDCSVKQRGNIKNNKTQVKPK